MRALWPRIDAWLDDGPFTARDFGLYRIIFAAMSLITLKQFSWLNDVPAVFFDPPPGPFRLVSGFPPPFLLTALDVALGVFLASLLIGLFTRTSSIAVFVLMIAGEGFSYSTGKIDHSILLTIVPGIMAFSGWGRSYSVDARLKPETTDLPIRQWLLRLLGFCIGIGMLTAGLPKLYNGWLNLDSQASFGYQAIEYFANERQAGLASFLVQFHAPWYWEMLDWATVILECAIIFAAFSWRWLRLALAVLTLFHLGVLLSLNISFWQNPVAYAAFVSWSKLIPIGAVRLFPSRWTRPAILLVSALCATLLGVAVWWISVQIGHERIAWIAPAIVVIGAVFGLVYLGRQGWKLVRRTPQ